MSKAHQDILKAALKMWMNGNQNNWGHPNETYHWGEHEDAPSPYICDCLDSASKNPRDMVCRELKQQVHLAIEGQGDVQDYLDIQLDCSVQKPMAKQARDPRAMAFRLGLFLALGKKYGIDLMEELQ